MPDTTMNMDYQPRLHELLGKHDVPGASVAILADGQVHAFSAGVANIDTQALVTAETIFPIGSITKVFTTSLIMQLVDAGIVALDEPVKTYLPNLELADPASTIEITVRDLLTHTSGIAGDYIYDTGEGPDAVEQYVRSLATLPILHPPRRLFSYSNSAFILAGYLIERLTGQTWHDAVRSRLIEPLELKSMVTLPGDVGSRPVGVPHGRSSDSYKGLKVGEMWPEFHAGAPAGFTPYATPRDVVRFAALHLNGGRTTNGDSLLSESSVETMQEPQVTSLPSGAFDAAGWGIGWALHRYGTEPVIGHNGGTSAILRVLPGKAFAVAVLTNVSGGIRLGQEFIAEIVRDRFDLQVPSAPASQPAVDVADLRPYEGIFRHLDYSATIQAVNGRLELSTGGSNRGAGAAIPFPLQPLAPGVYMADLPERGMAKVGFLEPDSSGQPAYFHMGLRAYARVS
jgi:CubicO group peptidase (beta-lactamase class C family)